jgi:hypothetical protein
MSLLRQLVDNVIITSRGAYQWQQHLITALTDARLAAAGVMAAAAAAAAQEDVQGATLVDEQQQQQQQVDTYLLTSCWEMLDSTVKQYDPLQQVMFDDVRGALTGDGWGTTNELYTPNVCCLQDGSRGSGTAADVAVFVPQQLQGMYSRHGGGGGEDCCI